MNTDLELLAAKISARLAVKSELLIIHPAELRLVKSMTEDQLHQFAADHGWSIVRRLGGRQIEFYNDAGARREAFVT